MRSCVNRAICSAVYFLFKTDLFIQGYFNLCSHGCIEVELKIFPLLRDFNIATRKNAINIKVKYKKGVSTNGGTKI
jgi:hypothetical protein